MQQFIPSYTCIKCSRYHECKLFANYYITVILTVFLLMYAGQVQCGSSWIYDYNLKLGKTVKAYVGQPVVLSCIVDSKRGQNVVGWTIENCLNSDFNQTHSNTLVWPKSPNQPNDERFMKTDSPYLMIRNVTLSDVGRYTCHYEQKWLDNFYYGSYEWMLNTIFPLRENSFNLRCLLSQESKCLAKQTFALVVHDHDQHKSSVVYSIKSQRSDISLNSSNRCGKIPEIGTNGMLDQQRYMLADDKKVLIAAQLKTKQSFFSSIYKVTINKWLLVMAILSIQLVIVALALFYYIFNDAKALYDFWTRNYRRNAHLRD